MGTEQGWDPGVSRYFRRILNTIAVILIWMLSAATAGLYFRLGYRTEKPFIYTIIFYVLLAASIVGLIVLYFRSWSKNIEEQRED